LAEVIKYGLIRDKEFFNWLETNIEILVKRDSAALAYAIERSCRNKAEVVAEDETESSVRATLNLGHTFGHAVETGMGYGEVLHGEAVAIGTCMAAELSRRLGWLNSGDVDRIFAIFKQAGLPVVCPKGLNEEQFIELMSVDKKNVDGSIRLILLKSIGEAALPMPVDGMMLRQTLASFLT
jgi:3-dehydroquinate synthase